MELRDYQLECIQTMHSHFQDNDRQIIQMPTGAGKTITFLKYLSLYSKKSLILVPTRELLEQVNGLQCEVEITFANGNKMKVNPIKKQQQEVFTPDRVNPWS